MIIIITIIIIIKLFSGDLILFFDAKILEHSCPVNNLILTMLYYIISLGI